MIKVATSGFYRVFVNGKFTYFGPVRCAHGYFRVDEIPIELNVGENHIAIQVVNYYVNSFYYICQNGFIQAEIISNGEVTTSPKGRMIATVLFPFDTSIPTAFICFLQSFVFAQWCTSFYSLPIQFVG